MWIEIIDMLFKVKYSPSFKGIVYKTVSVSVKFQFLTCVISSLHLKHSHINGTNAPHLTSFHSRPKNITFFTWSACDKDNQKSKRLNISPILYIAVSSSPAITPSYKLYSVENRLKHQSNDIVHFFSTGNVVIGRFSGIWRRLNPSSVCNVPPFRRTDFHRTFI